VPEDFRLWLIRRIEIETRAYLNAADERHAAVREAFRNVP
jgi:hypothetical protein